MGYVRRALVLVVALGLSGCWLQPGYGPERQNWNPIERELTEANVAGLHERWSVPSDLEGEPLVTSTAVYLGGIRYSAGERFLTVRALSRRSGTLLWQRDLPVGPSYGHGSVLSVAGDEVLTVRGPVSSSPTRFETLDAATGAAVETADVSNLLATATVTATGTPAGDVIASLEAAVTGGGNVQLVVRSRATFEVQWTAQLGTRAVVTEPLVVAHGRIWVSTEVDGSPVMRSYPVAGCSAPTCEPLTSFPVPPPDAFSDQVHGHPLAVTEDDILLMRRTWSYRGITGGDDLVAVDNEGTHVRTTPFTELAGVAAGGDTVVAVGSDGVSTPGRALVAQSWTSTWRSSSGAFEGAPVVAGGLVYVAVGTSAVHAYDLDGCDAPTCDEVASVDLDSGSGGVYGMSVAGGMLFVHQAGPGGRLFAFGPS